MKNTRERERERERESEREGARKEHKGEIKIREDNEFQNYRNDISIEKLKRKT